MGHIVDFAGVAGVIVASMGLALGIEWLSLRGLMRLMPARSGSSGAVPTQKDDGQGR